MQDTDSHAVPAPRQGPDFQINTSALKRAFPDFSQHGSSTEDSIEVGRGYNSRNARNTPNKNAASQDVSEALPFSFGKGTKYQLTGTPPIRPRTSVESKDRAHKSVSIVNDENEPQKETRNGSTSSGKASSDSRKTLVDRHTTVESDDSAVLQETKPSNVNKQTRNARFASGQRKENFHTPATSRHQLHAMQNNTHTSVLADAPATNQSYVIPDMPNITELITGHRQDGTPIFNRSVKSRSRFATPANRRASTKASHVPVENVPVPADTKALYVSLQLLQEKVTELESSKEQSEQKLEEYELEVLQLKSKLEEREHARDNIDSGIGSDAEDGKLKNLESDKSSMYTPTCALISATDITITELEASLRTLQDRLDRANRKINKSENQVSNLIKDRDALHAQLGLAYLNAQDDDESRALTNEVQKLRKELGRATKDHEKRMSQLTRQELELRGKIERREKAINEMASLAKELYNTRTTNAASSKQRSFHQVEPRPSLHVEKARQPAPQQHRDISGVDKLSNAQSNLRRTNSTQERRQAMRTDNIAAYDSDAEPDGGARSDAESATHIDFRSKVHHAGAGLEKDTDFMSFMDGDEVEKLRFVVEDERARLAQLQDLTETQLGDLATRSNANAARKSSMKKVSYGDFTERSVPASEQNTTRNMIEQRQDTQQSAMSQTSERRRRSAALRGEMTSGFLVPDVTLRQAANTTNGQQVTKQTRVISRPTPVSDRMPQEEDATLRPAQDPALALATVISNLQDELAHLRIELGVQEDLYHKHDPSLSQRKRKIVYSRIQKLLAAIETRADQIYALYDVLEGQKASGQTMKEDEVEVTLQNLSLDLEAAMGRKQARKTLADDESEGLPSDVDSDDDFPPWEGMEATQTQELDRLGRLSVH